MTVPIPASAFARPADPCTVALVDGLPQAIDPVAEGAAATHRFLRRGWFAAAQSAYGGRVRSYIVRRGDDPVAALPVVAMGPAMLGMASVPGSYWPFRSFPVHEDAGPDAIEALLAQVGRRLRVLRIGPVYDDDPALALLRTAAEALGWVAMPRMIAESFLLDITAARAEAAWPRASTLKKNRFHEKHLAAHGALDWSFVSGSGWDSAAFDSLAAVERASWIAERTDGADAKFTGEGHGAFWRAAAADSVLAAMMWAAVLRVDGRPAAFSFDLNVGAMKYAVANSYVPAFAKHSPGKLLYYRNLVRAVEDGIARVDWGTGDSGYKRTIGAQAGPTIRDWLFVRPGIGAAAANMLRRRWERSGQG